MAQRKIFLVAQYDSNLLGHVDLTDGTYNAVEHTHSSSIKQFIKRNGDLYIALVDYGARIPKYLGDGKFAPESEDIGVASLNSSADMAALVMGTRVPSGINSFTRVKTVNEWGGASGYQVVDAQDNVLFESDNYLEGINPVYPAFEFAPGVQFAGGAGPTMNARGVWLYNSDVYGLSGNAAFANGKLRQLMSAPDGNFYMVESTIAADRTCSGVTAVLIGDAVTYPFATDKFVLFSNGEYVFSDGSERCWKWNGSVAPVEVMGMPYGIIERIQDRLISGDTGIYEFENEIEPYQRGAQASTLMRVSIPSLVKEVMPLPVISEIPADATNAYYHNMGMVDGIKVTAIRGVEMPNGDKVEVGALLVENYPAGTYQWYGDFTQRLQTGRLCPLGEFDENDVTVVELQPYEVKGVIEKDGSKVGTDLILVDNDSMSIVGRTKSDPVTGAYKFRCYTNNKKSVFAQHPVSKGLRLAAEVTPKLL